MLTTTELREVAPSVFAAMPESNVSKNYTFVSTQKVLETLIGFGWFPVEARQDNGKNPMTARHEIKLENKDFPMVNGIRPQIILGNSHNRSQRFFLGIGWFRLICSNGLMVSVDGMESDFIKTKHIGFEYEDLEERILQITAYFKVYMDKISAFQSVILTPYEQMQFAEKALKLRWKSTTLPTNALLTVRRDEDAQNDLFTIFNRIQESLIQGDLPYVSRNGRNLKVRPIKAIKKSRDINQQLWNLLEETYKKVA